LAGLIIATPVRTSSKAPCPTLAEGSTYKFVSTTGTLTGSFSNAPEGGPEVPIFLEASCHKPMQTMRITYNRTGSVKTVVGTIEAVAEEIKQEAEAAAKKHEAEIAANHPHPEESVAKGGVLAAKETARPKSPTRAQLMAKALKACRKQPTKHRRAQCAAQTRRKYGSGKRGGKGHKKK
jgi:hypothetical protein